MSRWLPELIAGVPTTNAAASVTTAYDAVVRVIERKLSLTMFNAETVVHLIGDPCLKLYQKGKGCWCFEFDDHGLVGTKMVLVKRLNDLPLETWVNEGRTFAAAMRAQRER